MARVRVELVSRQTDETGTEVTRREANGLLRREGEACLLSYVLTEEGERRRAHIVWGEKEAEITQEGATKSSLLFRKGERTENRYLTPYGELVLEIETEGLQRWETKEGLQLQLVYTLQYGASVLSRNEVEITVRV